MLVALISSYIEIRKWMVENPEHARRSLAREVLTGLIFIAMLAHLALAALTAIAAVLVGLVIWLSSGDFNWPEWWPYSLINFGIGIVLLLWSFKRLNDDVGKYGK